MDIQTLEIAGQKYIKVGECLVPDYIANCTRKDGIKTPSEATPYFSDLKTSEQEIVKILTLDANNAPIACHSITIGLVNSCQIHPREIFRKAISDNAVSFFMAHNHPSGKLEASEADLAATKKIVEAGKIVGITLLDHLIITKESFLSIREKYSYQCF